MPDNISEELKDLLEKLLNKDPNQRLGLKGANEIKAHPFFEGLDWQAVYNKQVTPPYIPTLKGSDDVSNFHKVYIFKCLDTEEVF